MFVYIVHEYPRYIYASTLIELQFKTQVSRLYAVASVFSYRITLTNNKISREIVTFNYVCQ